MSLMDWCYCMQECCEQNRPFGENGTDDGVVEEGGEDEDPHAGGVTTDPDCMNYKKCEDEDGDHFFIPVNPDPPGPGGDDTLFDPDDDDGDDDDDDDDGGDDDVVIQPLPIPIPIPDDDCEPPKKRVYYTDDITLEPDYRETDCVDPEDIIELSKDDCITRGGRPLYDINGLFLGCDGPEDEEPEDDEEDPEEDPVEPDDPPDDPMDEDDPEEDPEEDPEDPPGEDPVVIGPIIPPTPPYYEDCEKDGGIPGWYEKDNPREGDYDCHKDLDLSTNEEDCITKGGRPIYTLRHPQSGEYIGCKGPPEDDPVLDPDPPLPDPDEDPVDPDPVDPTPDPEPPLEPDPTIPEPGPDPPRDPTVNSKGEPCLKWDGTRINCDSEDCWVNCEGPDPGDDTEGGDTEEDCPPTAAKFLELINAYRVASGKTPVILDSRLTRTAYWQANYLNQKNFDWSLPLETGDSDRNPHRSDVQGYERPENRMDRHQYPRNWRHYWENATGVHGRGACDAIESWKTSDVHNTQMLKDNATHIGFAIVGNQAILVLVDNPTEQENSTDPNPEEEFDPTPETTPSWMIQYDEPPPQPGTVSFLGVADPNPPDDDREGFKKYSIVADISSSMETRGKWELVKKELLLTVNALPPKAAIDVVLFNDEIHAFGQWASPANHSLLEAWLNQQTVEGNTDPIPALDYAFRANPDVMFLLTDGEFQDTPRVANTIRALNENRRIPVNVITLSGINPYNLENIADANNGSFKIIG